MNPRFPLYIVSKGRWKTRHTMLALDMMKTPYRVIVEEQEFDDYASVLGRDRLLVLDKRYQREYDLCEETDVRGTGSGPARNFAWEHSIAEGWAWHWVMDDNIKFFARMADTRRRLQVTDGAIFACMEDFALRYSNVAMAGPNYYSFAITSLDNLKRLPPFVENTRIYSCNLIRNDVPFRWAGRYNEDTHLSLRMLKAGWCTILFNAFLQGKLRTMTVQGGNTSSIYTKDGVLRKTAMLARLHPDVVKVTHKFGRIHHHVDYKKFQKNRLLRRADIEIAPGVNNYGMRLTARESGPRAAV